MGRLIDGDRVIEDMQYYHNDCETTSVYTKLGFETAMEVVKSAPTVEAIPKDQYEARLKADMVAILTEIKEGAWKHHSRFDDDIDFEVDKAVENIVNHIDKKISELEVEK